MGFNWASQESISAPKKLGRKVCVIPWLFMTLVSRGVDWPVSVFFFDQYHPRITVRIRDVWSKRSCD